MLRRGGFLLLNSGFHSRKSSQNNIEGIGCTGDGCFQLGHAVCDRFGVVSASLFDSIVLVAGTGLSIDRVPGTGSCDVLVESRTCCKYVIQVTSVGFAVLVVLVAESELFINRLVR